MNCMYECVGVRVNRMYECVGVDVGWKRRGMVIDASCDPFVGVGSKLV